MNKNYKAECKKDHHGWYLSVTHNGYQWASINIKDPDHEVPLLLKALNNLTSHSSKAAGACPHSMADKDDIICPQCLKRMDKPPSA